MVWQDTVLAVGSVGLLLTLLPTLADENAEVPRTTSIPTAMVLYLFAGTYSTMGFWASAGVSFLTASVWAAIAVKRAPAVSVIED